MRYHPKFASQFHSGGGIIMILVCHVVKGSCGFIGGTPTW